MLCSSLSGRRVTRQVHKIDQCLRNRVNIFCFPHDISTDFWVKCAIWKLGECRFCNTLDFFFVDSAGAQSRIGLSEKSISSRSSVGLGFQCPAAHPYPRGTDLTKKSKIRTGLLTLSLLAIFLRVTAWFSGGVEKSGKIMNHQTKQNRAVCSGM